MAVDPVSLGTVAAIQHPEGWAEAFLGRFVAYSFLIQVLCSFASVWS